MQNRLVNAESESKDLMFQILKSGNEKLFLPQKAAIDQFWKLNGKQLFNKRKKCMRQREKKHVSFFHISFISKMDTLGALFFHTLPWLSACMPKHLKKQLATNAEYHRQGKKKEMKNIVFCEEKEGIKLSTFYCESHNFINEWVLICDICYFEMRWKEKMRHSKRPIEKRGKLLPSKKKSKRLQRLTLSFISCFWVSGRGAHKFLFDVQPHASVAQLVSAHGC